MVKLEEALKDKKELMYFYWAHDKYINISRLRQTLEKKMKNKHDTNPDPKKRIP